jgi:hypothetical protein
MRSFTNELPAGSQRDELLAALEVEHPLTAFVEKLRTMSEVQRQWRRSFTGEVTGAITRWMSREQLSIDLFHMPTTQGPEPAPDLATARASSGSDHQSSADSRETGSSDQLRQQILQAVARMSLSELLRLPIPAEYLLKE